MYTKISKVDKEHVYVKHAFRYHDGTVFGKAVNEWAFFIVTSFGGTRFLLRMLPLSVLDAPYLFEETQKVNNSLKDTGGRMLSIISDNNRVN